MDPFTGAALILVIVGWGVVNHQNNRRETRKEARAAADRAKQWIAEVATAAVEYAQAPDVAKAAAIKMKLELAERELETFPNFKVKGNPLMGRLMDFQDAATGGAFESGTAIPAGSLPELAAKINITLGALTGEIERQFTAYYK